LFSSRHLNVVAVLDIETQSIKWYWGLKFIDRQHHATLLDNDNILIFDNGSRRGYSRVIEVDPATGNIQWEYKDNPKERFFSNTMGSAQRLPNGNTLITESNRGRVFEVTPEREIVWEFFSTGIDKKEQKRATMYRMIRVKDDFYKNP